MLPVFVADTAVPLALLVLFPEELVLEVELGAALVKARSCGSSPEPGVPAVPGPPPPCHTGMLEFSSAVDTAFHPFWLTRGQFCKNAPTVLLSSSCSRMMRPGDLGPVIHFSRAASTLGRVVPPLAMLQSSVLHAAIGQFES